MPAPAKNGAHEDVKHVFDSEDGEIVEPESLLPNKPEAAYTRGFTFWREGLSQQALRHLEHALSLKPDYWNALYLLAQLCMQLGRFPRALACLDELFRLDPNSERMEEITGLKRNLLRAMYNGNPALPQPYWDGSHLSGKTILLHDLAPQSEQEWDLGIGDLVELLGYAVPLSKSGNRVLIYCRKALHALFSSCPEVEGVFGPGDPFPECDVQASLRTLPRILQKQAVTAPYLFAEPGRVDRWQRELRGIDAFKVGMNWHGDDWFDDAVDVRAIPLHHFGDLAQVPGLRLISLQKGAGAGELAHARLPLIDLGPHLDNDGQAFVDTAAVLTCLDLFITSDAAVAHVAGALGVATWLLLPMLYDERWKPEKEMPALYPSMTLFRVTENGGTWNKLFQALAAELKRLVELSTGRP
jgi:hypothetical protein